MSAPIEELRDKARTLLEEGAVSKVFGWVDHPTTGLPIPRVIEDPAETANLVWNELCEQGLVRLLNGCTAEKPIAILARACETRQIAVKLGENDIPRENVFVIALGCDGIVDYKKLGDDWTRVESVKRDGQTVTVSTDAGEKRLSLVDDLLPRCIACPIPQPVLEDARFGEFPAEPPDREDPFAAQVAELEAKSDPERRTFFESAFARCIRCYACRQVCPLCSCEQCIAEETRPQWIPRATTEGDNQLFLTLRAMHLAGRCTECGACERACPMDLPLMALNTKLATEVERMFSHVAGADPEAPPPLSTYRDDDPELPGHGGEPA